MARSGRKRKIGLRHPGGTLPATLDRLATLLERERSLSANLRSAISFFSALLAAASSVVRCATRRSSSLAPRFCSLRSRASCNPMDA